jgi:hypothetical protein
MVTYEEYAGQDVAGINEAGCPYIGQTVDDAVSAESLAHVAETLGITIEALMEML